LNKGGGAPSIAENVEGAGDIEALELFEDLKAITTAGGKDLLGNGRIIREWKLSGEVLETSERLKAISPDRRCWKGRIIERR